MSRSRIGRWTVAAAFGVLPGALALGACGLPTDTSPRPLDDVPFGLVEPATTVPADEPTPSGSTYDARLYYVSGTRLVSVDAQLPLAQTAQDQAVIVLAALAAGPRDNLPVRSVLTASEEMAVTVRGGLATVELDPSVLDVTPSEQLFAVGQIVLSLTRVAPVVRVQFTVADQPVVVPLPDLSSSDGPLAASDYFPLLTA